MSPFLAVTGTTASLIGAGAGFAGGIVAAGITEYIRGRRDRDREGKQIKAAIRLIDEELRNAHDAAEKILAGDSFAPLPTQAWEAERVRVAAALEEPHWVAVAKAYDRMRGYNWRYEAGVLLDRVERETVCQKVVRDSTVARDALQRYVRAAN